MLAASLFDITGRTALVTGGNSGIGLAIARGLGLAGASVILVARRLNELANAAAVLNDESGATRYFSCDLAEPKAIAGLIARLDDQVDEIDILVNAAGINLRQGFAEVSAANFDLHTALHLRAPFLLTQALAYKMASRGWGRILNLASLQSVRAFPNSAPYGAAKGGIVQLTRAIAEEFSSRGVTCNALAPGFFPTPLTEPVFADQERAAANAARTAIARNGALEDLYGAAIFFCSEASAYVTGQTLFIDGGFTAK